MASSPSHSLNSPSLSFYPDLIMSVVSELVASLESHGRQLHSEVGHMVRWVTRADSSRPRDGQRDQAAASTPHSINNTMNMGVFQESATRKETVCDGS